MKLSKPFSLVMTVLFASGIVSVYAQSTAFTYQGRLRDNNIPATGVFDLRFVLYDAVTGGNQVGADPEHTVEGVQLINGLFSVLLNFGADAFTGGERWLEISLRPGSESSEYTKLAQRRQLTPAPYSLHARHAATTSDADLLNGNEGAFYQNADNLTSGTVSDERLSANAKAHFQAVNDATSDPEPDTIVKRDSTGSFVAEDISVTGKFSGDGSGLVNIPASSIVGGGGTALLPSGITIVSTLPNDTSLVENGCKLMMTVPAPPWVTSAGVGSASARFGHSAVWDGQRLIIWGGRPMVGSIYLDTGASYRPDTDHWKAVSTVDAPSARWGHTAVWNGSQMLVWGGNGASGPLNTGGRFYPDRQLWRPISVTGSPAARSEHVAVWTGTQMFIWGGLNGSGLLNDGGLYSPGTDQWSGVVAQDAPVARVGATAVWAEDRVLIWGGEGGGVLNSGSQLLFEDRTTRWVAMTLPDAFAARRGHSAIWTGSKMIIWGGQSGGVPFGDGAAYDPGTDSWEMLSSIGAPVGRFNHTAVWTGQEMLILGGSNGSGELASGAAYDPATATWRPLINAGSPRARTEATAAWTGTEVLVFGGRAQGVAVGSLQMLVPQPVWYFYRKL